MEVKEGERATVKLPASAVKPVWALCSECVRTCAYWCAFAQSALTPFKVTASWGEHPCGDQCPAHTHPYFTLLLFLLYCPLNLPLTFHVSFYTASLSLSLSPLLLLYIHFLMTEDAKKQPWLPPSSIPLSLPTLSFLSWLPTRLSNSFCHLCRPLSDQWRHIMFP